MNHVIFTSYGSHTLKAKKEESEINFHHIFYFAPNVQYIIISTYNQYKKKKNQMINRIFCTF